MSLELVQKFWGHCEKGNYSAAAALCSPHVKMVAPGLTEPQGVRLEGHVEFINQGDEIFFKAYHWGELKLGVNEYQVINEGTKRIGLFNQSAEASPLPTIGFLERDKKFKRIVEVSKGGEIVSIRVEEVN